MIGSTTTTKVFVYFNLHKRMFSLRAMTGPNKGRVIAHRDRLVLSDCRFRVSEAGRKRVVSSQRKNVHAGIVGMWCDEATRAECTTRVTYNPYMHNTFVVKGTNEAVYEAKQALLVTAPHRMPEVFV